MIFVIMEITYKDIHDFKEEDLKSLFLSVEWSSGQYPDKLVQAMKGYETVYSAWDNDRLVGLACAMDDSVMTAYVHYLLVRPDYQGKGIGVELMRLVNEKYKDYLRIVLHAYNDVIPFYEKLGYKQDHTETTMFLTSLTD